MTGHQPFSVERDPATENSGSDIHSRGAARPNSQWRAILRELDVRPSKALGQNFLHDAAIVRRIVETAQLGPHDLVVEVGPGLGVMTRELSQRAGQVVAIELDQRLAGYVRGLELPHTTVIAADVLSVDLAEVTQRRPYIVVANLPYSVAAAAITHILDGTWRPSRLIVMVQREVAERIVAGPPEMSILAVAVQFYGKPKISLRIGPGAFVPAPKVDSAVLTINVNPVPPLVESARPAFFKMVRAGFGQRRKQLMNALAAGLGVDKITAETALRAAAIDPRRRAETLEVSDWLRLFSTLPREGSHA